jgi:hypothetical protein
MRPFGVPYLGRVSFAALLSDMPVACATAVTAPMMQMEVVEGDEDGGRREEKERRRVRSSARGVPGNCLSW